MKKKLLIISNNVLSETNNNGKTILSFISGVEDIEVSQLYFSGEIPKVDKYKYFQISDKDIIRGLIDKSKRGRIAQAKNVQNNEDDFTLRKKVGRNDLTLALRELLWKRKWKSEQLQKWLEEVSPDAILFVAGDAVFAYDITEAIQQKYNCRLTVYITDDYVMPRENETFLHQRHRKQIRSVLKRILTRADCFYTISEVMREEYRHEFGKDSELAVNMCEDLREKYEKQEKDFIFSYAGSFYYGRAEILGALANAIRQYNADNKTKPARLLLYSNSEPDEDTKKIINIDGASEYKGSLDKMRLKERLNTSDVLVFVESFDKQQIEKVKYSLSTKVPEYMSVGKPILAIGPEGIGSMNCLQDVAYCIHERNSIQMGAQKMMAEIDQMMEYGQKAREKYLREYCREKNQETFINKVIRG